MLGLAVDPNYADNNWIYLFYSPPTEEPQQYVSRFDLIGDSLHLRSEKILLKIPLIRECCHSGGSLEFGADGLLYIGVGDNTNPFKSSGFAPIDERPGRALYDAQRSAANTNDFRGKILRIQPEDDGTYSIPNGNLFPVGTPQTKPEIYVMGCRNPFRFSIDATTGNVYWGDVGPDAGKRDSLRGPAGMGEFNQAKKAGFWGWPYTRGNNQVYHDFNFSTKKSGQPFNPTQLINDSPNNSGLQQLPPAQSSMIWFSYATSKEFPWLGKGGVNPMAGPVYHTESFSNVEHPFPNYFDNKLFVYEWMRDWIYIVTLDSNQNYVKADPFMANTEYSHPMDMIFGTDGYLYVLEYGQKWNSQNIDARLNRIRYNEGNRPPLAQFSMDRDVGAVPLTIQFFGEESIDFDKDELTYQWSFTDSIIQSTDQNPVFTFEQTGEYDIQLHVTDSKGERSTTNQKVLAGNDRPILTIQRNSENDIYWKNKTVNYKVTVQDTEDGNTNDQSIPAESVKVTLSYIPEGEDMILATTGHQQITTPKGLQLINESDCRACHANNEKVAGPSYMDIATTYDKEDKNLLVSRIIKGSSGIWGETMMAAHPQLSIPEVELMVQYILSLDPDYERNEKELSLEGQIQFLEHLNSDVPGRYILMASYLDKGNPSENISALSAQESIVFRAPRLELEFADEMSEGPSPWDIGKSTVVGSITHGSYLKFKDISFQDLKNITLAANYNADYEYLGAVEIRIGSTTGQKVGEMELGYFDNENRGLLEYQIPIESSTEKNDLYLVFVNESEPDQFVLNADWIFLEYSR